MSRKTVRRNAVNKIAKIIRATQEIKRYSLGNGFDGQTCNMDYYDVMNELGSKSTYFYDNADGTYTLHIHSNLWYVFNTNETTEVKNEPVEEIIKEEPVIEPAAEVVIEEVTEREELNWYEQKQQNRKDYYLSKAGRCDTESDRLYDESKQITEKIPFGQPILVGHHSERRHRKDLNSSWNKMGKSVEASRKADYYRDKAKSVGTGGISSDDPDAIAKLTEKVTEAKTCHEQMKAANKLVRKGDRGGLKAMGYRDDVIDQLLTPDFAGRIGFPSYQLTNNRANIKRLEARIAELQRRDEQFPYQEIELDYVKIIHDPAINRVQLIFDGKPEKQIRDVVKQNGFRWSRYNMAWQRQLNKTGVWQAQRVAELIKDL